MVSNNRIVTMKRYNILPLILLLCTTLYIIVMWTVLKPAALFYQSLMFILACICVARGRREQYLLNPYYATALYPLTLAFYIPSVSSYYFVELSINTYILSLYCIIMFVLGLTGFTNKVRKKTTNKGRWIALDNPGILKKLAYIFSLVGFVPIIYAIATGLPGGWNNIKFSFNRFPLADAISLLLYAGVMCAFCSKSRKAIILSGSMIIIMAVAMLSKTSIMMAGVVVLCAIEKRDNRNRFKIIVGMVLVLLVFSYLSEQYNILRETTDDTERILTRVSGDYIDPKLIDPYMYLVMPWRNLDYIVQTQDVRTYGLWTLKPFINYLQLDGLFRNFYTFSRPTSFNTYGFIAYLFKDFGYFGAGLAAYAYAVFVKRIYLSYIQNPSPLLATVYALNFRAVLMMFFNNHWATGAYPITIYLLMAAANYFCSTYLIKKQ